MEKPGGGPDIVELLRSHGKEAIFRHAESAGLRVAQGRLQCPFQGCVDQGKDRRPNVVVFAAEQGKHKLKCHRCGASGDLLDLLELVNHWTKAEAIAFLAGTTAPAPRPTLRVVPPAAVDPEKLTPAEVRRIWDGLAKDDELGRNYLESRNLADSPLFRYATESCSDSRVKQQAKHQRRVAMLLGDVVGNARGIQFRLSRDSMAKEAKQMSLKGSSSSGAFFGQPELVEQASLVLVAEGMADTAALQLWAGDAGITVGAPGKDGLHHLAGTLKAAGIPIDGKVFALFPQNDRPKNLSRREFVRLGQLLTAEGAQVVMCSTPDEWKDIAQLRTAQPDGAWPPPELARSLCEDVEQLDDTLRMVKSEGAAVPLAAAIRIKTFGQNFTSLCALLDDPVYREPVMGLGELAASEMTGEPLFNGASLDKSDYSKIRLGLEMVAKTPEGKQLKFSAPDISEALGLLASRKKVHPVRDWLRGLKWNGVDHISEGLPKALGLAAPSLEAHLLRKWIISVVARPLHPGCKVDTVLVLAGDEGIAKSTFFEVIGGKWFTDAKVNIDDDNGKRLMRRSWIVEWAELDSMRRARDQESIKAFLSQKVDVYRPLWSESLIEAPRHSVIVGTTNHRHFLLGDTGNRRFWPLWIDSLDIAWVQANRDQVLAQAVHLFDAGEQWWLEPEYTRVLIEHHAHHEVQDDWETLIAEWSPIRNGVLSEVTGARLLEEVIKKPVGQWTNGDQQRIGRVMKSLGWTGGKRRENGKARNVFLRKLAEAP